MSSEQDDLGRWLMQVLYDNYDNYVNGKDISKHLEVSESRIIEDLNQLIEAELVESKGAKYRLSEKGYRAVYQRFTSFCPHL